MGKLVSKQNLPQTATSRIILQLVGLACLGIIALGLYKNPWLFKDPWHGDGLNEALTLAACFWALCLPGLFFPKRPLYLLPLFAALAAIVSSTGLLPLASLLLIWASSMAIGSLLFFRGKSYLELIDLLLATVAGLGILITLLGYLSHFPINTIYFYLPLMLVPVLLQRAPLLAAAEKHLKPLSLRWNSRGEYLSFCVLLFPLTIILTQVLRPEYFHDSLACHLAIAAKVADIGYWPYDFDTHIWALLPFASNWGFSLAYLFGGEAAARLLNFSLLIAALGLLHCTIREFLPRSFSYLLLALFASTALTYVETISLFVDNFWMLFALASFLALTRAVREERENYFYLCAFLIGVLLAIKVMNVFLIAILLPIILWAAWQQKYYLKPIPVLVKGTAIVLSCGLYPYIYAYAVTGNPVFPFYNAIFESPHFDVAADFDNPLFKRPINYRILYDLAFHSDWYLESGPGAFGYHYILLVPLFFFTTLRRRNFIATTAFAVGAMLFCTIFQFQSYLRYIYPTLPLILIGIAHSVSLLINERVVTKPIAGTIATTLVLLNMWTMPVSAWPYRTLDIDQVLLGEHQEDIVNKAPQRKLITYLNEKYGKSPTVLFLGSPYIAKLKGRALTNGWYTYKFAVAVNKTKNQDELLQLLKDYQVSHIVIPIGNDKPRWRKLIAAHAKLEHQVGQAQLYKLS